MTGREPVDARLRLLERDVDRHAKDIGDLRAAVEKAQETGDSAHRGLGSHGRAIEGLTRIRDQQQTSAAADDDAGPGIVSWLTLDDPAAAGDILADLADWLRTVYVRYPGSRLADCWAWHPSVVAELLAVRDMWTAAYEGERASARAVMDWHDRDRPGTARRVGDELGGCSLERHTAGGPMEYRPARLDGTDLLGDLADWWADSHGATAAPPPTPAMLAEARARLTAEQAAEY